MGIINTSKNTQSTKVSASYDEYYKAEAELKKLVIIQLHENKLKLE